MQRKEGPPHGQLSQEALLLQSSNVNTWITVPVTTRASSDLQPHYLVDFGKLLEAATIRPCTFTMDLDEIVCFMID